MHFLRIATIVCVVALLAACSSTPDASQASGDVVEQNQNITSVPDANNDGLAARVNGVGIPLQVYDRELGRRLMGSTAANEAALGREVLSTLIRQQVILQAAPSIDIVVTDEDIQAEIDNLRSMTNDWEGWLIDNGYTEEEMWIAQRDSLLTQRVRDHLLAPYLGSVLQVNARHIVVRTSEEANSLLERMQSGEGFATLAAAHSLDTTTRENGGNLGWFARNELFYPNLEEVAFNLENGEIAGPIATSLGYHIVQTLDKAERPVETERLPMLAESIFGNWVDQQMENATVERYLP